MISNLLRPDVQEFIRKNEQSDLATLLLQEKRDSDFPLKEAADQIKARKRARLKLPSWYKQEGILFPPALAMEQCSSEITAEYKASLVGGKHLADLTGGAGVDTFYLSKRFDQVDYVDRSATSCEIAHHNHGVLGAQNISQHCQQAEEFLQESSIHYDCIYLDPARRGNENQKVFFLSDCEPNMVTLESTLLAKAKTILLKTAPLLDLDVAMNSLKSIVEIHIVSVNNECKEVVYLLKKGTAADHTIGITCINFTKAAPQVFHFDKTEESNAATKIGDVTNYLYEPNASIMKGGAFKSIRAKFALDKLHVHSHLYSSKELVSDFPGRIFEVVDICPVDRKALAAIIPEKKANIAIRNFPDSVEQLRKKLKISDGGEHYIFATTLATDKKVLIVCTKTKPKPYN